MNKRRVDAFQQGSLDGFCGLYSIVNAMRLALGDRSPLRNSEWNELFHAVLAEADQRIGAVHVAICGIGRQGLWKILKSAIRHMATEHDLHFEVDRPLLGKSTTQFGLQLAELSDQPQCSLVVCFEGDLNHWTVIRKVRKSTISLFDSDGLHWLRLSN